MKKMVNAFRKTYNSFFNKELLYVSGVSLYYVVFISFVIVLITGAVLLLIRYQFAAVEQSLVHQQVKSNVRSGIALYRANPQIIGYNEEKTILLYGDKQNSVTLTKTRWGFFEQVNAKAFKDQYSWSRTYITGNAYNMDERFALYMPGKKKYLSIGGDTRIIGDAYLPGLGIRRAYIDGVSYTGEETVYGEELKSNSYLPLPDTNRMQYINSIIQGNFRQNNEIIFRRSITFSREVHHNFDQPATVYYSRNKKILNRAILKGKCIFFSEKGILVKSNAEIEHVILVAPYIEFESEFKGNCQAFARDSIRVGEECNLTYPSIIAVINNTQNNISLTIEKNTTIEGGVCVYQQKHAMEQPKISLDAGSLIHGIGYFGGRVSLYGDIEGTIYANGFYLKTDRTFYNDHLLDVSINSKKLSEYYVIPVIFNEASNEKEIMHSF